MSCTVGRSPRVSEPPAGRSVLPAEVRHALEELGHFSAVSHRNGSVTVGVPPRGGARWWSGRRSLRGAPIRENSARGHLRYPTTHT